uniref:NADH-ubiquinone oxidoreductase chain 2 n=1 Tax=Planorbella duryi TaxID=129831 RepID=A0A1S6PTN3_9GAST|nr:NADH dehydrogenase subunit 2 [Planorbella duryi]
MQSSNMLFLFLIFFSPVISLSASDWIISWIGMELGIVGLFPLMLFSATTSSKESMLKYFLVQSMASLFLLISGIVYFNFCSQMNLSLYLFLFSLSLKLGFFPGHFWVPSVVSYLSWVSNLLILGPVKIAPFGFLSFMLINNSSIVCLILILGSLSALLGAVLGNNQTMVRGMLGSSSISHSGWMCVSACFGCLWGYLFSYIITLCFLFLALYSFDYFSISVLMLSLTGLPPFIMFLMKMKVLFFSFVTLEYCVFSILILSSIISLNFYLKFFYYFILTLEPDNRYFLTIFSFVNFMGAAFILLY